MIETTEEALELEAEKLQKLILEVVEKHIPKKKFYEKSKPWWSEKLTRLRKEMAKCKRKWKRNADSAAENTYIEIRRQYYFEIKLVKLKCWNSFLKNAKNKDIFKAFQYIK